jgi:pimeloyl-ACP methyl ester carboxylesterase
MRRTRVTSDGVELNVYDWRSGAGDEQPLLCIHGITGNGRAYDAIAAALAGDWAVIAPDLRGRGQSDKPHGPFGAPVHARDMLAVLDALDLASVAVAGWSLGGVIALHLAAMHPERVTSLVLLDPPLTGGTDKSRESLGRTKDRLLRTYPDMQTALASMRDSRLLMGYWDEHAAAFAHADLLTLPDGTIGHSMSIDTLNAEWAAAAHNPPLTSIIPRVTCPVLLLRAPDTLFQPGDELLTKEDAERAVRLFHDARTLDIPGTNHFTITLGHPTGTFAAMREFLGTTGGRLRVA